MSDMPSLHSPAFRPSPDDSDGFWPAIDARIGAFVIGSAKCATKWLAQTLRNSPQLVIPGECNGLTQHANANAEYYNRFFAAAQGNSDKLVIDYSNTYMLDRSLARKLANRFGDVKVIMAFRDPVARAFSHYLMDLTYGVFNYDAERGFRDALCAPRSFSYFDFGLYGRHLAPFIDAFGPERILVIDVDGVEVDREAAAAGIYAFLELQPVAQAAPSGRLNTWEQFRSQYLPAGHITMERPRLKIEDRLWLEGHYRDEHRAFLEQLKSMPHVIGSGFGST